MSDLSWLPYDCDDWERRVRELGLTCFEEGALMRLLRGAWRASVPCTVLDTPDELARLVGSEWKKALKVFRAQFVPLAEDPTRRRCGWLYDLYLRQFEKHLSYKNRGQTGGKAKAAKRTSATAQLEAELEAGPQAEPPAQPESLSRESSTEALSCAPTEHTAKSPASVDALAPEGAALPAATNWTSDYLERPSVRDELLKRGVRPAEGVPMAPDIAEHHSAMMARGIRDAAHYAAVKDAAWRWMRAHPTETKALGRVVRPQNNLPLDEPLTGFKAEVLERAMVAEISAQQEWPSADEWDGKPIELRPIPQEAPC